MRRSRTSSYVSRAPSALLIGAALCACTIDGQPKLLGPIGDGGLPADGGDDAGDDAGPDAGDGGGVPSLFDSPRVERAALITLEDAVVEVQQAGEHTLLFHAESGVSLLDTTDPTSAHVAGSMPTTGRAIATRYDAAQQVVWILTVSGDLRAYRLTDRTQPLLVGSLQLPSASGGEAGFFDLARVGDRLFALQDARIVPIGFGFDSAGEVGMTPLAPVDIKSGAERIAEGGPGLFVVFAGGVLRSYSAGAAPIEIDEVSLRGDVVGWAVRGERLLVAIAGVGVRLVELEQGEPLRVLLRLSELDDPLWLARAGELAVVALQRGVVLALDLSVLDDPRGIGAYEFSATDPPDWIAIARGDLLLGTARALDIVSLPPIVEGGLPALRAQSLPRYARIPLRISKPLDPDSVTIESVVLRCEDRAVPAQGALSGDRMQLTLLPRATLPARAHCAIELTDVRDDAELALTSSAAWLSFTTDLENPSPIASSASQLGHTADGVFTDFNAGAESGYEYSDVGSARSALADVYADYGDGRLWLMFDVIAETDPVARSCSAVVSGFSAEGADVFELRVFGDDGIEAGGVAEARVEGATGFDASPSLDEPHFLLELALQTEPGRFRVQVHTPASGADCGVLREDPIAIGGTCSSGGCTIDPSVALMRPSTPSALHPSEPITSTTPTLSWASPDLLETSLSYAVDVSTAGAQGRSIYRAVAYRPALALPAGVLHAGNPYSFEVQAMNAAGVSSAARADFEVITEGPEPPAIDAPVLETVTPELVTAGTSATLTLLGSDFIEGAQAFVGGASLSTTFVSSMELSAVLPASLTEDPAELSVRVRNDAADPDTESNAISIEVVAPCTHSECETGESLFGVCSDCASDVCGTELRCCTDGESWDDACVALAQNSDFCACEPP